jgi:hypothetical protein
MIDNVTGYRLVFAQFGLFAPMALALRSVDGTVDVRPVFRYINALSDSDQVVNDPTSAKIRLSFV